MKIALLLPEYYPNTLGGGALVYKMLAKGYVEQGHEVQVLYGDYSTNFALPKVIKIDGLTLIRLSEFRLMFKAEYLKGVMPLTITSTMYALFSLLKFRPNVAHIHGYGIPSSNTFAILCTLLGIKYVFTLHGYPETQNSKSSLVKKVWNIYDKLVSQQVLKHATQVTAVSKIIGNSYINKRRDSTKIIYNSIDIKDMQITKSVDVRSKYQIPTNTEIILSIGRITHMKGFQDVVLQLKLFNKEVLYIICGEDFGYKSSLQQLIDTHRLSKKVLFAGYVGGDLKNSLIKDCDMFAIPSINEPFGLVALEAMYYGKPIWYRKAAGLVEVLENYPNKYELEVLPDLDTIKDVEVGKSIGNFNKDEMISRYLEVLNNASK